MLRVGRTGMVSFPNFGCWKIRWQLLAAGRMPVTDYLPYEWYDTPNIHLLTVRDFHHFCASHDLAIDYSHFLTDGHEVRRLPNVFAKLAIFAVRKRS